MDPVRLRALGTAWETVRRTAPTHPHPVVPRRPPGNALLGVPLSVHDRVRDALGGSAAVVKKVLVGLAGALVAALAAVVVQRKRH
ncbi:hypothetical protein GCM10019016_088220 [Streptomyces prasinosporus]|uniref:DUF3618 domain-containing protein n=1 Tax=Streptomyces prasinosporus TaxID=68256 RepID=A0ABP6U256_9ACTN